ncbi:unnamed protein product [Rangifer tarandus platyrhynchus]|uniref:Uncharacterized protein n=2 Tax=Rangifer tarandus platyrhynchus TaxID=3082113 RepID=A0ABN8Z7D4_RANTA|nr:unnamed protein product [Rangifer tarandus platyrhynchus]
MSIDTHRRGRAAPEPGFTLCLLASEKEPVSRGSSRSVRARGRSTPPAKLTHDSHWASWAGTPLASAAALAAGDISLHEHPGFKVSAGIVGVGGVGEAGLGEGSRVGPQEEDRAARSQPEASAEVYGPDGLGAATPSPQAQGT